MILVQCKLSHDNTSMVAWIEKRKNVKEGNFVTLKEDKSTLWKIEELYYSSDSSVINKGWEVGGLGKYHETVREINKRK
jgi:hypothetical protein